MSKYSEKAMNYFSEGYNCAQSVVLTFADEVGMDKKTALMLSSSFGGGMGRLREVCGAVSGMFIIAGLVKIVWICLPLGIAVMIGTLFGIKFIDKKLSAKKAAGK